MRGASMAKKDPADNWLNNSFNSWAEKKPWRVPLVLAVFLVLLVLLSVLKWSMR